jgi:hypothetical protein
MSAQQQKVEQALDLSLKMLNQAKKENWDEVTELCKQREILLRQGFQQAWPPQLRKFAMDAIEKIRRSDADITALAQQSKQQASATLTQMRQNHKAVNLYAGNFRLG